MKEIELTTIAPGDCLALAEFQDGKFLRVRHRQHDWSNAWSNILQIGLYQKGPDVSEIGSTWSENLVEMRALVPFTAQELRLVGGREAFLANAWTPVVEELDQNGERPVHSIPWLVDTRLVHYRADLLARAGVDAEGAFATAEAMYDTLMRLQAAGIEYPLAIATGGLSIHVMASWVWGSGGSFRSPDCRKIALVEPEARRGMVEFFRLHRFIHPQIRRQDYRSAYPWYLAGNAAVLVGEQWVMKKIKEGREGTLPIVTQNSRFALPPGVPFLGSTHLVLWRHSLHEHDSLRLIAHLTGPDVLRRIFAATGNLPARIEVLEGPPFSTDPDYRLVRECLHRGRRFRSVRLWAGVERRLNVLVDRLWKDVFTNPEMDLEREIERRVRELAVRLEKTLLKS